MTIDGKLLEILACPACRERLLELAGEGEGLACVGCRRVYPIRDGIPVLLVEEATRPSSDPGGGG